MEKNRRQVRPNFYCWDSLHPWRAQENFMGQKLPFQIIQAMKHLFVVVLSCVFKYLSKIKRFMIKLPMFRVQLDIASKLANFMAKLWEGQKSILDYVFQKDSF